MLYLGLLAALLPSLWRSISILLRMIKSYCALLCSNIILYDVFLPRYLACWRRQRAKYWVVIKQKHGEYGRDEVSIAGCCMGVG